MGIQISVGANVQDTILIVGDNLTYHATFEGKHVAYELSSKSVQSIQGALEMYVSALKSIAHPRMR